MKFRYLLLALASLAIAAPANAASFTTTNRAVNGTYTFGGAAVFSGTVNSSGVVFSTALTGNPLMQMTYKDISTFTSTAMTTVLASASGRTIYPGAGLSIMVSGTAASATAIALECSGGK